MNKKYWGVLAIALGVVTCMWTAVLAPQVLALALLAFGYWMLRRYFAASTIVLGVVLGSLITIVLVLASPARRSGWRPSFARRMRSSRSLLLGRLMTDRICPRRLSHV